MTTAGGAGRPRVVHLGLGNFHRAHQAVYTRDAGDDWVITGVAHRSRRVVDALRRQDMRYTLLTVDRDDVRAEPVDTVTEALTIADDAAAVVARLADPATSVVTLTITEAGYLTAPRGGLDLDDADLRHDLAPDAVPTTALGVLARGLAARAAAGGAPVTVVSCDNVAGNGDVLRAALEAFAAAARLPDLAALLAADVGTPSTMVDRIVPATTPAHVAMARAAGFDDEVPVPTEPFRQWVLGRDFRAGRPAWERAGALVTDEVHAWETVKVRLLNGVHSLIAYLGLLRGHASIADAYADPMVRRAADALGDEYVPTLARPTGLDVGEYRAALSHRWGNTALGHRTAQVGSDGSRKLVQRVPEPVGVYLGRGAVPSALALLVASFLAVACRPDVVADAASVGSADGDRPELPVDPSSALLRGAGERHRAGRDLAEAVLVDAALLGGGPTADPRFVGRVGELLDVVLHRGAAAAVDDALG